jgi:cyclase
MPEFRKLAEGVFAFLQPPLVFFSNAGVIVGERDVIVVDSLANAAMATALLAAISAVTDLPVRLLVNTHDHADHTYTNHLFAGATTVASHRTREATRANRAAQEKHAALYARLFPEVDLSGGRYTVQDEGFAGSLSISQGGREVRLLELAAGHSESDVVVHLPAEGIVFCGDVFLAGLPPLPAEGRVRQAIANYEALETLGAALYVPGHGPPGTLDDVRAQRTWLQGQFHAARECFERGLTYDQALREPAADPAPLDFRRLVILASYWEFAGRRPDTTEPASRNHLTVLAGVAAEARRRLVPS